MTRHRIYELHHDPSLVPHTLDAAEVRAIHRHLFQDVYDWAGQYRVVDIAKADSVFAHYDGGIQAALEAMTRHNRAVPWSRLNRDDMIACAATTIATLNHAHPFREGNGRTSRALLERLAAPAGFTMRWRALTPQQWADVCARAMPRPGTTRTRPSELHEALGRIIQPTPLDPSLERIRTLTRLITPQNTPTAADHSQHSQTPPPPAPQQHQRRGPHL